MAIKVGDWVMTVPKREHVIHETTMGSIGIVTEIRKKVYPKYLIKWVFNNKFPLPSYGKLIKFHQEDHYLLSSFKYHCFYCDDPVYQLLENDGYLIPVCKKHLWKS